AVNHRGGMPHRDEMVESINRGGGKAFAVHGDVGDPASVKKMFAEAEKRMGGLDILVNAAGLADPKLWNLELSKTTLEMWQRVFAVDAFGTFLCSQAAAGIMKRGSSIVNIASTPALAGDREGLVYASAKGAVASMTRMMAKMLAPKIRVNCMVFGSIETSWVQWLDGSQKKEYLKAIPLGRFGKPEEAADLALFFASDQSSFITGQALVLDGGEVLR
ncbi:MAG TPA: SDR family oxidoreductase, partial [Nitrososphaerales archaeon]|nr:SDR family oxidoreductase [Nitrososphaerales archaeon]